MMPSKGKKQRLPRDVLSNLPENVIDDILMSLPLRDAARTSILSKRWRYKWCRLPQLMLDDTVWGTTKNVVAYCRSNLTKIISSILKLHSGPIEKFALCLPYFVSCPNIDNLICFLSKNSIHHLALKIHTCSPYKLPSSFFTCLQLRHLTLLRCLIHPPPVFKGFGRLISLELCNVTISSELLGSLISHCPLLENLVLIDLRNCNHIEINAPNLRSFFFEGNINVLHLKTVPLLSKVTYKPRTFSVEAEHDLTKMFESIPALENLCWNLFTDVDNGIAEVIPTRLPSTLNCLKRLRISWITLRDFFELSFALCLIRSSPNLEEIEIEVHGSSDEDYYDIPVPQDVIDKIPASFSDMTFNHLRIVKINNIAGAGAEMQLIKVLLVKSPALVKMVIRPCEMENKKSLRVLMEITNFQRASSEAQVVYNID
ncbi:F-box/FBD/LRR-repeat protein At1g13570-like [Lycium barbarum]|uniref:F-box/FBD/LRR-repeat protein At1g13570-like n=1 Tax=Lycium barbarum TaxID=112863 RepID=UPI00293E0827|nr:F-box/FBD/LRR-repeat protein At1g13570-like [Lycium barbarum]XP_060214589.1 F-box/FBD/LRR-repeat protein At1g13570-like [Lycium barbarum]XP_060214590.1 F-box/FBD/LRR-repeat protein At1g13570-like [Lycium barbarum]XP_060214591.1 F-box/FBD/LRR-repeat protein At1g13570-like [Lycium barbarum]